MIRVDPRQFADRREAGRALADRLSGFAGAAPIVLALPRGGVPVGDEVARRLEAPLDVVLVRKIGAPGQRELAVGAVVDGSRPEIVLNQDVVAELGVTQDYIDRVAAEELAVIERRRKQWLADRTFPSLAGRTVIIVDDGIATGATMRAAIHAVRRSSPGRLVVAVPVGPPSTICQIAAEADEVVCLKMPEHFGAIGFFYRDFTQVEDAEVARILAARKDKARD